MQWRVCGDSPLACRALLPRHSRPSPLTKPLRRVERHVSPSRTLLLTQLFSRILRCDRLCLAVIVALPAATPKEFRNTAKFALGNFTNCMFLFPFLSSPLICSHARKSQCTIGPTVTRLSSASSPHFGPSVRPTLSHESFPRMLTARNRLCRVSLPGSFDSSVHISEEASNAATAVPYAIVFAIAIAGILGWGERLALRSQIPLIERQSCSHQRVPRVLHGHRSPGPHGRAPANGADLVQQLRPKGHARRMGVRRHGPVRPIPCPLYLPLSRV